MRVLSWNLWWRHGRWWERQEAIVAELRRARPDVCGLQEVWDADGEGNLAAPVAEELGMYRVYAPSPVPEKWQRRIGDDSVGVGDAVLSHWPIAGSEGRRLPAGDEPDEGRTVLHAQIDAPHASVPFFVTHLNSAWGQSGLRREQVVAIAGFMREKGQDGHPPVLAGDFNAPPDADEVRCLVGKAPPPVRGFVLAGELQALTVLSEKRCPDLPEVPTAKERGYDVSVPVFGGIAAPVGTPRRVVEDLGRAFDAASTSRAFARALVGRGREPAQRGPEAFAAYVTEQSQRLSDPGDAR